MAHLRASGERYQKPLDAALEFIVMNYDAYRIPELREMAKELGVADIAEVVLSHPHFGVWTASNNISKHHYGKGGLQHHTWEVCKLCLETAKFHSTISKEPIDLKILFLGALFHDVGKIWDYEPYTYRFDEESQGTVPDKPSQEPITNTTEWWGTQHRRKIHHISRSASVWQKAVAECTSYLSIEDDVLHCILSHHGLREWGSPVMPKTREAWILHHCDSLSARMNDCDSWDQTTKK